MFDTSLVRAHAIAAPRRYSLLAVSFAIHSAAVMGGVALTIASTELPSRAPNQLEIYRPVFVPAVLPAYGHPERPKTSQPAAATAKVQLPADTAPNTIPDQTSTAVTADPGPEAGPIGDADPGLIGVPWGDRNSVSQPDVTPQPEPVHRPEVTFTPGGDVTAARVIHRVEPRYPQIMIASRMPATVTVHCTIDKNGRIRDPEIVTSSFPPFNDSVLEAVRQWTFAPGRRRGEPVDTYFQLTVRFVVN